MTIRICLCAFGEVVLLHTEKLVCYGMGIIDESYGEVGSLELAILAVHVHNYSRSIFHVLMLCCFSRMRGLWTRTVEN